MDKVTAYQCVLLSELPRVGPRGVARILATNRARHRSPDEFLRLPESAYREEYRLPPAAVECLSGGRAAYERHCERLAERFTGHGGVALILGGPGYPCAWEQYLRVPPPVVFALGDTDLLQLPAAAVLNSRTPSSDAIVATQAVIEIAAGEGFAVATGAMKLGHRVAAAAARAARAPRIIVLDRGLFAALGDETERDIFGLTSGHLRLDRTRTVVLSAFRLDNHAAPANGARRDALIAALADLVICVDARSGGHMEQLGLGMLARGKVVASWRGQNQALVAAGARMLDDRDLAAGLTLLLAE